MTVLVTGGSEGIGLAVAAEAVKSGADVTLWARSHSKLEKAKAALEAQRVRAEQRVSIHSVDVSDPGGVARAAEAHLAEHGPPERLFHCAGYAVAAFLDKTQEDDIAGMLAVNLGGTIRVARAFAPAMARRGKGAIVLTASDLGFIGLFGWSVYTATKHGVVGFASALRHELKPHGVSVQALCPPATQTPGFDKENATKPPSVRKAEESGGVMRAADVGAFAWKRCGRGGLYLIPNGTSRMVYWLSRLWPSLVHAIVRAPGPGDAR